jgi:hypothetical protein
MRARPWGGDYELGAGRGSAPRGSGGQPTRSTASGLVDYIAGGALVDHLGSKRADVCSVRLTAERGIPVSGDGDGTVEGTAALSEC